MKHKWWLNVKRRTPKSAKRDVTLLQQVTAAKQLQSVERSERIRHNDTSYCGEFTPIEPHRKMFVANWHTNVIKERLVIGYIDDLDAYLIKTVLVTEQPHYTANGLICGCFDTYNEAVNWIKERHAIKLKNQRIAYQRALDKAKHVVKFYATSNEQLT